MQRRREQNRRMWQSTTERACTSSRSSKKLTKVDSSIVPSKLGAPATTPQGKDDAWSASEGINGLLEENVLGADDTGRRGLSSAYASLLPTGTMDFPSVAEDKAHTILCSQDNRGACGVSRLGRIIGTPKTNPRFRMVSHFCFRRLKQGYLCFFKGISAACGNPIFWHFPMRSAASLSTLWHFGLTPSEFARHLLFLFEAGLNILPLLKLEFDRKIENKRDVGIAQSKTDHSYTRQILTVVDMGGGSCGGAANSFGHHNSAALDEDGDVDLELSLLMSGEALDTARLVCEVLAEHYAVHCEAVFIINIPESPHSLNPQRGQPRFAGTAWWDLLQQCNAKSSCRCPGEADIATTSAAAGAATLWRKGGVRVFPVSVKLFGVDYASDPDFLGHVHAASLLKKSVRSRVPSSQDIALSVPSSTVTAAVAYEAVVSVGLKGKRATGYFVDSDEELALWGWLVDEQQLVSFALGDGEDASVRSPMGSLTPFAAVSEHEHDTTSYRDHWKMASLINDTERGADDTISTAPSCTVKGAGTKPTQIRHGDGGNSQNKTERYYAVALADGDGRGQVPVQGWLSVRSGPPVHASSDWKPKFAIVDVVRGELLLLPLREDFNGGAEAARALIEPLLSTATPKPERGGDGRRHPPVPVLQRLSLDDVGSVSLAGELNRRWVAPREPQSAPGPFFQFYYQGDLWELQVRERSPAIGNAGDETGLGGREQHQQLVALIQPTPSDVCLNSATWVQALECHAADHERNGDLLRQRRLRSLADRAKSQLQNGEAGNNNDENNEDSNRACVDLGSDGSRVNDSLDANGSNGDDVWSTRNKKPKTMIDAWKHPAPVTEQGRFPLPEIPSGHPMDPFPPPVPVRYPHAEVIEVEVPLSPNDYKPSPSLFTSLLSLAPCDDNQEGTIEHLENGTRRGRMRYGGIQTAVEETLETSIESQPWENLRMRSSPSILTRGNHSAPRSVSSLSWPASSKSGTPPIDTDVMETSLCGPIHLCGVIFCRRCYLRSGEALAVVSVSKGCPADYAGLQAGDVVLGMDGTSISVSEEVERHLRDIAFLCPPPAIVGASITLPDGISSSTTSSILPVDSQPRVQGPSHGAPSIYGICISPATRAPPSFLGSPKELLPSPLPSQREARRLRSLKSSRDHSDSMLSPSVYSSAGWSNVSRSPSPRTVDGDRVFRSRSNSNLAQPSFRRGRIGKHVARSQSGSSNRIRSHRSHSLAIMPAIPPPPTMRLKVWRFKRLNGPSASLGDGHVEFSGLGCSTGNKDQKAAGTASRWYGLHQELAMQTGQHVCVSIDAETRGMHVQQTDKAGLITIIRAVGDAAVRGMRRGDVLVGVQHSPLPVAATLAHVQELMEALPRPLALNLYRPSTWEAHEQGEFAPPPSNCIGGESDVDLSSNSMSARDFGGWREEAGPSPSPSPPSSTHRRYRRSVVHTCDLSAPFKRMPSHKGGLRMPPGMGEVTYAEGGEEVVTSYLASVGVRQRRYWFSEFHHSDDPGAEQYDPGNGGLVY